MYKNTCLLASKECCITTEESCPLPLCRSRAAHKVAYNHNRRLGIGVMGILREPFFLSTLAMFWERQSKAEELQTQESTSCCSAHF